MHSIFQYTCNDIKLWSCYYLKIGTAILRLNTTLQTNKRTCLMYI
jgi:hypothetical protein